MMMKLADFIALFIGDCLYCIDYFMFDLPAKALRLLTRTFTALGITVLTITLLGAFIWLTCF